MKTYELPSEVTIDVSRWTCNALFRTNDSYCAVGALCQAAGIPEEVLRGCDGLSAVEERGHILKLTSSQVGVMGSIMMLNDGDLHYTESLRDDLRGVFEELGVALRFSDEVSA